MLSLPLPLPLTDPLLINDTNDIERKKERTNERQSERKKTMGRSTGLVVKGGNSYLNFVSSNPGMGYWKDIFLHTFDAKIVLFA